MNLAEKLGDLLTCPHDMGTLSPGTDVLSCTKCGRRYPRTSGIVHLVTNEAERPRNPRALAADYAQNSPELLRVDFYRRQAEHKEHLYRTNGAFREAVDFVVAKLGVGADLASGNGGGYIAPTVRRMGSESLLLATDACLPVIENWYAYLAPEYADRFAFLDIDLSGMLCFADARLDVFTAVAVSNVNDGNPESLLREVARCLKPQGWAVLQEMIFSPTSETCRVLTDQGNLYASLQTFADRVRPYGLELVSTSQVSTRRGKICDGDGWPVSDDDEWSETILYLRKVDR